MRSKPTLLLVMTMTVGALLLAGCSSDDKDSSSGTSVAPTTVASGQSVAFDREVQQWLIDVGCYTGAVDGVIGPETDSAILAFQTAEGLEEDGELGPQTQAALRSAANDKRTVCTSSGTTLPSNTTVPSGGGTAPCTATALLTALPSGFKITQYACSEGYAGVQGDTTDDATAQAAVLKSEGGKWVDLSAEESTNPCGAASAGIPPAVLSIGCPA